MMKMITAMHRITPSSMPRAISSGFTPDVVFAGPLPMVFGGRIPTRCGAARGAVGLGGANGTCGATVEVRRGWEIEGRGAPVDAAGRPATVVPGSRLGRRVP